jgi:adenylate kinase
MEILKESHFVFCFFGRSGSGKGVQSQKMIASLNKRDPEKDVLYVETGQLFRNFIKNNQGFSSDAVRKEMERGGLLPAFLPVWMWSDYLVKNYTGKEHLIFDGVARRLNEAPILEDALRFYNCEKPYVIYIEVSPECVIERLLKRGRSDDTEEKIMERLDWYEKNVVPSIDFFRNSENVNFVQIDGDKEPDEIHREIVEKTFESKNDKA